MLGLQLSVVCANAFITAKLYAAMKVNAAIMTTIAIVVAVFI
jgi:hypothetical protein